MQRIIKGDRVRVNSGKYKNKEGVVLRVFPKLYQALVEGINVVKKHQKSNSQGKESGIIEKEMPIYLCKLRLLDARQKNQTTKVKFGFNKENLKVRLNRKTNTEIVSKK